MSIKKPLGRQVQCWYSCKCPGLLLINQCKKQCLWLEENGKAVLSVSLIIEGKHTVNPRSNSLLGLLQNSSVSPPCSESLTTSLAECAWSASAGKTGSPANPTCSSTAGESAAGLSGPALPKAHWKATCMGQGSHLRGTVHKKANTFLWCLAKPVVTSEQLLNLQSLNWLLKSSLGTAMSSLSLPSSLKQMVDVVPLSRVLQSGRVPAAFLRADAAFGRCSCILGAEQNIFCIAYEKPSGNQRVLINFTIPCL